ncbi:hypothetical protein OSB04_019362 [Centaurea solstitialis]|uniref:Uncharacterized protein n=1 Tax=Centaurea solstitialis TaxID=347529 RepID=A0AA38SRU7_9ASTR|nr:hypothetical protein OSB04_019362 [Centaurea solstitialis]
MGFRRCDLLVSYNIGHGNPVNVSHTILTRDYGYNFNHIPIYCDSKSAIAITCNPVQQTRTKHIDIRYHFIKDHVEKGKIEIYFVNTEHQLADLFTKPLDEKRFNFLISKLGLIMDNNFQPTLQQQLAATQEQIQQLTDQNMQANGELA